MKTNLTRVILFAVPLLIQSLILIIYLRNLEISTYGSNDDALIASFSVDNDLGADKDNWIFIKSLLSVPATFLQSQFPEFGIYGLLLGLTIILSTSALYCLIDFISNKFLKIIFTVALTLISIVFTGPALINPTYTGAAIFAGASGFALIYFALIVGKPVPIDLLLLASGLISLAYLIRAESFLLSLGFFFSIYIFTIIFNRDIKNSLRNIRIPILFFSLIFSVNFAMDNLNYNSDDWQEYLAVNELRHSIQMRSAEYYLQENLSEIGWTEAEFTMFQKFSIFDEKILSADSLAKAVSASESTRGLTAILNSNPKNELIFINYSYRANHINVDMDWLLTLIIFLIFTLIVSLGNRSINLFLYLFPVIVSSLAINYIFAVSYHLPPRLTFNFLFLPASGILIVAFIQATKITSLALLNKILSSFMAVLFTLMTYSIFPNYVDMKIDINESHLDFFDKQSADIETFKKIDPNAILVGTGSRIVYNLQNPYKKFKNISADDRIVISGWHNLSPISNKKISSHNFPEDGFHRTILNQPNIYWIDDEGSKPLLQKYFQEQTEAPVTLEDFGYLGDSFYRILKISKAY